MALSERVDEITASTLHREEADEAARDKLKGSTEALEGKVANLAQRLDGLASDTTTKEAASDLRLKRLETNQAVTLTSAKTVSPNRIQLFGYDASQISQSELEGSEPSENGIEFVLPKVDPITADATLKIDAITSAAADDAHAADAKAAANRKRRHSKPHAQPSRN